MNAPPRPPRPAHQQTALDAYAAPIVKDAHEHAELVLTAIEHDVQAGLGKFSDEVATVVPIDEWYTERRPEKLHIPEGAVPWAKHIWRYAFGVRFAQLAAERLTARVKAGEDMLRRHLQSRESNHELQTALDNGPGAVAAVATGMRSRA